jgi:cytochrome c-type protein NapC
MDLTKQTDRAADIHTRFLLNGGATCIDCHKGIAHELPDMTGVEPGWRAPPDLRGQPEPQASFKSYHELAAFVRDAGL